MKIKSQLILLVIFLFLVGCAGSATVQLRDKEGTGKYLTDDKGMTLYHYKKDLSEQSTCLDDCIKRWPIFYSKNISAASGLNAREFTTIDRVDGDKQTVFRGRPLYYFFQDKVPGDMKGEGVNKVWYVINPDNFKP
jgi:predicted lipoprotein with Yx(FWY)xxD motif